ncbi:DDE-type integrase/transposase/recombinase [Rhodanobacter sp. PCA2]|uniref:DDE-type integrase/transposase/recombinase n=1 Tax=Rhodanobacter sp. PCA2 TaxID=2006117 RepID=UPI0015E706B7|nr:DDE-type integrase/transposase/recombinase [Rhodanobacter sp. PCA2]
MAYGLSDIERFIRRFDLKHPQANYLRSAAAAPARAVGQTGYPCVVTDFQSRKMGKAIACESRTGEYRYALELEWDEQIEAFFDQPPQVDVRRTTKRGERLCAYYPDFLVLKHTGAISVVQVKLAEQLDALVERSPDWIKQGERYLDLSATRTFEAMGLVHEVVAISAAHAVRAANLKLLIKARAELPLSEALLERCEVVLRRRTALSLQHLAKDLGVHEHSALIALVAHRRLQADIDHALLVEPATVCVALSQSCLRRDVVDALSFLRIDPKGQLGAPVTAVLSPREAHLERAISMQERLEQGEDSATARRWRHRVESGLAEGIPPLASLTPRYDRSGNRLAKRPAHVLEHCRAFIKEAWGLNRPSRRALYSLYRESGEAAHPESPIVSKPTFRKILKSLEAELAYGRGGLRTHNAHMAPTPVSSRELRATRPFELASADHCLCKIFCVVLEANGFRYVKRPWLTVLRDCCTKEVLAYWVSFRAPSRRQCAVLIRQCVRAHGRLPEQIIVDRGADFRSVYFAALFADLGVDLVQRPTSHSRYGSEAEGLFNIFKTQWLTLRPGNLVDLDEVRSVSSSHKPERLPCMDLTAFYEDFAAFSLWQDQRPLVGESECPRVLRANALQGLQIAGVQVTYDDLFVVRTAVDSSGRYKVSPRTGIHKGDFHFWHPDLSAHSLGKKVDVRDDPEDPFRLYALMGGQWITALASHAPRHSLQDACGMAASNAILMDCGDIRELAKADAERLLVAHVRRREETSKEDASRRIEHAAEAAEAGSGTPSAAPADAFAMLSEVAVPTSKAWSK